jgi:NADPH-dependent 2,4-dienoyl-CoA reductase/sulfur reductase-like enzyme
MSEVKSKYCVDVVVIGGGFAGLAAGIEARLAGASVLLVEKMARPGAIQSSPAKAPSPPIVSGVRRKRSCRRQSSRSRWWRTAEKQRWQ